MEVVLIVLGALVLALIVWMLFRKQRERRREEAGELRETARSHEVQAQQHKAEATQHARQAAEVDPDTEQSDAPTR
jgi:hypothetical protein